MPEATLENPVIKEADAEKAELRRLVEQADSEPVNEDQTPSAQPESAERAAEGQEEGKQAEPTSDNAEASPEMKEEAKGDDRPRDEQGRFVKGDEKPPVSSTEEKKPSDYEKAKKEQERRDRSWKALDEEKARVRAEADRIRQREAEIERERQRIQHGGTEEEFSSKQYEKFAEDMARQARLDTQNGDTEAAAKNYDLAFQARNKAAQVRQTEQTQQVEAQKTGFTQTWKSNMERTIADHPDLGNPEAPISKTVMELFKVDPVFNYIPDGFAKAHQIAQWKLGSEEASALKDKNQQLEAEVARLQKLVSPLGDSPSGRTGPLSFDQMSHEQQKERLREMVHQADGQAA